MSVFTIDIPTTLIGLIVGFIVYKLARFYALVFSLPPGPLPLPFVGNILYFRGTKQHWSIELERAAEKYGPVFTMWIGTFPLVFISDIDIARDAFSKNDFAGRPDTIFARLMSKGDSTDIITADFGNQWEALRSVAHSAAQKYSSSEKLVYLVCDCVDHTIKTIIEKEGLDKPFEPYEYIYSTYLNILSISALGVRFELDDPEYKIIKFLQKDTFKQYERRMILWEMFPLFRKLDYKLWSEVKGLFDENIELLKDKFESHYEDYDESVIRDFCDTLINAKNEALREGKESATYLNDTNLTLSLFDLFIAGKDTSESTFRWILFFMFYYPEVLKKLRQEIESEIGDRIPIHEDRDRCHYVMAFISEVLRLRNIVPPGVNHKAVVISKIGDYTIPKGTQITVFQGHILRKEEYWHNSKEFIPERFLENGKYMTTRPKAFIPFGVGRRVCLGEKLAIQDLFLVLVRFIQKTADYELVLHYSGDTEPDPNRVIDLHPKDYKVSLKKQMV